MDITKSNFQEKEFEMVSTNVKLTTLAQREALESLNVMFSEKAGVRLTYGETIEEAFKAIKQIESSTEPGVFEQW